MCKKWWASWPNFKWDKRKVQANIFLCCKKISFVQYLRRCQAKNILMSIFWEHWLLNIRFLWMISRDLKLHKTMVSALCCLESYLKLLNACFFVLDTMFASHLLDEQLKLPFYIATVTISYLFIYIGWGWEKWFSYVRFLNI